jgi:hypothetical protein
VDERLETILRSIPDHDISQAAAGALGAPGAVVHGLPVLTEITAPHADARTIGIVQVSGLAAVPGDGSLRRWSSVTKLIDMVVEGVFSDATIPANEETVYERRLFTGMGLGFRPAHCHHISHPSETLKVLWLEDLTGAKGPPFEVDELRQMVRHLGEWNAANLANPPALGFEIRRDYPIRRWNHWKFPVRTAELAKIGDDPMLRAMYARQPLELANEFADVLGTLNARSAMLPHVLSFGDGPVGNYFYTPEETIAVDWSGLSEDVVGADGGCFIGSALTWGQRFADIAAQERELFESYADGLMPKGRKSDRAALRAGYLSHLTFYLASIVVFPTIVSGPYRLLPRDFLERRFGMPIEEIGDEAARIIDRLPSYIAEARELMAQGVLDG